MATPLSSQQKQEIVELLQQGIDKKAVAMTVGVTPGQVAAIAAHMTMRTYEKAGQAAVPFEAAPKVAAPVADLDDSDDVPDDFGQAALAQEETPGAFSQGMIFIGHELSSGQPVYWTPTPELGTTNPHLLIVGESGSGKTYSTQCLCTEFAQIDLPTIVFDFGQGFTLDTAPPEFIQYAKPIELEAGRAGININPLQIFPSDVHGPLNVAQRIADTFARVYSGLGVQQHAALRDAVLHTYSRSGIDPDQQSTWLLPAPRFSDLREALDDLATNGPQNTRRYAATVASHISTVFVFNTFRATGLDLDWAQMLGSGGHTYIIQLKGLEYKLERAVTELLLWNLLGYIENLGPGPLRCMVLLDEAHRLSFSSHSPVEKMLREGRKFGMGVILASQQPEDFSSVAFSNTATKLILNISDDKGTVIRQLARKADGAASVSSLAKQISNLERGQAVFLTGRNYSIVNVASFSTRFS